MRFGSDLLIEQVSSDGKLKRSGSSFNIDGGAFQVFKIIGGFFGHSECISGDCIGWGIGGNFISENFFGLGGSGMELMMIIKRLGEIVLFVDIFLKRVRHDIKSIN